MALADLANIILDPDIKLPVQVYHEKKTTTDVTINCLESDDLQGFKPLSKSSIGDVSFFDSFRQFLIHFDVKVVSYQRKSLKAFKSPSVFDPLHVLKYLSREWIKMGFR